MDYGELKESIAEVLTNDKINKTNLMVQYSFDVDDFNKIFLTFLGEFGGVFESTTKYFDIESEGIIFRCLKNG